MRQTEYWRALLGGIILLLVLAFPQGIVGASFAPCGAARMEARHERARQSDRCPSHSAAYAPSMMSRFDDRRRASSLRMIGPNGAGKSTCFNMINGQLKPDSGQILFDGQEIAGLQPREIWRLGVGRTFQVAATFSSMTVIENVQMALIFACGEDLSTCGVRRARCIAIARSSCSRRSAWRRGRSPKPRTCLWRRQARRACHRARQRAAPAADGRADRRHGAARAQ